MSTDCEGTSARPEASVLVVDDVPQNLVAMQALLQRDGVRVIGAASGAEALERLLEHDVALALLDVQMPEMDGFALAELMRGMQRTREIPIIFLTASPSDPVRSFQGYESGAVDFLHKPIDPRVILSKVGVFVDLYRQRQLLRLRNAELERVLKLNETMIAVLTHDLRTPLSAVMMSAEVLRLQARDETSTRAVGRLKSSVQRMSRMIEQLLDFSRIRSAVLRLQLREDDLGAVANTVIGELRQAHPGAMIELLLQGPLDGVFDSDRLAQVLSNLVGNAVRHGAPQAPVRVSLDGRDPDRLLISVVNDGCIPSDVLPHLFEPFKGMQASREGLGLGLYIVDQFVRAHGGHVSATNAGERAKFDVSVPRRVVQAPATPGR